MKTIAIAAAVLSLMFAALVAQGIALHRRAGKIAALQETLAQAETALKTEKQSGELYRRRAESLQAGIDSLIRVQAQQAAQTEAALSRHPDWASENLPDDIARAANRQ